MILIRILIISISINSICFSLGKEPPLFKTWDFSAGIGSQMSGIKPEDFVRSNYSPLLSISGAKWINTIFALQLGIKGVYFNAISDNDKHYYSFIYSEVIINTNSLINKFDSNRIWNLNIHGGPGFFYNFYYGKPNLCGNLGIQNSIRINHKLEVYLDISSIVGFDIYQGDEDILPGLLLGLTFNL